MAREFALTVVLPGFNPGSHLEVDRSILNVAALAEGERRGHYRNCHRRLRFSMDIDDEPIAAQSHNGISQIRVPVVLGSTGSVWNAEVGPDAATSPLYTDY